MATQFTKYRQPFTCHECGKRTTGASGENTFLCPRCNERAGLENDHSDNGHNEPVRNCPTCEQAQKGAL